MKDSKTDFPNNEEGFSLGHISVEVKDFNTKPNLKDICVLPTRNLVLFPGVHLSIGLGRDYSERLARFAEDTHTPIVIACQRNPSLDTPGLEDLFDYGVVADILKVIDLPDGSKTALVRGRQKCHIVGRGLGDVFPGAISARITNVKDVMPSPDDQLFGAIMSNLMEMTEEFEKKSGGVPIPANMFGSPDAQDIVNSAATNLPLDLESKFEMLKTRSIKVRAKMLLEALQERIEMLNIRNQVVEKARVGMENGQRNAFLQQQMDAIREELYGDEAEDADAFARRLSDLKLSEEEAKTLTKEIDKLRRLNPQSPDYAVQYSYLDTVLSLPWNVQSPYATDLVAAQDVLEKDHYGLEKVKERIIEQLAVIMDNPKAKSPIICLVGPPGVGKTSLGASVAKALGRKYERVALGGLHDEAEIRGHRRTYIGAMPGRIIDAVKRAGTNNPVLLLDEIDKIGADFKGDPAAALLEVLDPEQNCHFHDNYVDIDFDLSNVLFIATANSLQTVSRPLLDRIEVIEIAGYLPQEKIEIAKRHLLPKLIKNQGWRLGSVAVDDKALDAMIGEYTSESGVRQLEKLLGKIMRKAVLAKMRGEKFAKPVKVSQLKDLLGTAPYRRESLDETTVPGVVTGLAWTQVGGETLLVEVSLSPAKGEAPGRLTLTGNLGDVMKESATIALQWIKAHAAELNIDSARISASDVHIHFPEGAIPKDGPSAGITMVTALVSAFRGQAVPTKLAMTGETTLRGKVLPVGGIREKLLAARRAGVTDIIVCEENRRDVEDIPADYLEGVTMHYVSTLRDVLSIAVPCE